MARLLEQYLPPVNEDGIITAKAVSFQSTLAVTGATTLSGATTVSSTLNVTGTPTFTLAPVGPIKNVTTNSAAVGATVVLTIAQSGGVFLNVSTSGSPSWTLPVGVSGTNFCFITANTTTGFTVTNATQVIHFKTSSTGTALTSTTTLTNTQATAVVGDAINLVCDGTAWWATAQTGIYAAS